MRVERTAGAGDQIELWLYEQTAEAGADTAANRKLIGFEQPLRANSPDPQHTNTMICWSTDSTLGNVPIFNPHVIGRLPCDQGEATLGCDIVEAGKMRNGARRWWCRTHQRHWGTKKDIADAWAEGAIRCSNHAQQMSYIIDPPKLLLEDFTDVEILYSFSPGLAKGTKSVVGCPNIYVKANGKSGRSENVCGYFDALSILHACSDDLFGGTASNEINITPPAAMEFTLALENGLPIGCVNCRHCGCPHQDLGKFGQEAHIKHLCSNCGRDSLWSPTPMVSTPLSTLHSHFDLGHGFEDAKDVMNLDEHPEATFSVWPSMPALLWTYAHPQKRGIRVELRTMEGAKIHGIFGEVVFNGIRMRRSDLIGDMILNTIRCAQRDILN